MRGFMPSKLPGKIHFDYLHFLDFNILKKNPHPQHHQHQHSLEFWKEKINFQSKRRSLPGTEKSDSHPGSENYF